MLSFWYGSGFQGKYLVYTQIKLILTLYVWHFLQAEGFNEKLHLIVDVFSKCLKSLADDSTEEQFNVFVQQQFQEYQNDFLSPEDLSVELLLNIIHSDHHPLCERNKRLRSIKFGDFQRFCRNFCDQVRIKALIQGNVTKDLALKVVHNVLNELNCGRVEDVSFYWKWNRWVQ